MLGITSFGVGKLAYLLFLIISFNLAAYYMPKRMSKIEMYTTSLFALYFQAIADVYLDLKYHYYWQFHYGIDFISMLFMLGVYPAANIIILNFFPYKDTVNKKIFYIACWSVILLALEWGATLAGWFHHREWKLWHSALSYPIIIVILALNLWMIRNKLK